MKAFIKIFLCLLFFSLPIATYAWQWLDLWQTADQQGAKLLREGKPHVAAQTFNDPAWQASAFYRAKNFEKALQSFNQQKNSDGHYNAGNAAAHLGQYEQAIKSYDKAIALNPNNADAVTNRDIVKKLLEKKNREKKMCSNPSSSPKQNQNQNNNQQDQKREPKQAQNNSIKETENKAKNNASDASPSEQVKNNPSDNASEKQSQQNSSSQTSKQNKQSTASSQSDRVSSQNSQLGSVSPKNKMQESVNSPAFSRRQAQEDQKQALRRLPDDPGGLLRQKFMRDYYRRHANEGGQEED